MPRPASFDLIIRPREWASPIPDDFGPQLLLHYRAFWNNSAWMIAVASP